MQNYSTIDIYSISLLLFFIGYFFFLLWSAIRRFSNRSILSRNKTLKKLKRLSWDEFEYLCMELYEKIGWDVIGNEKKGADGGVDIWMKKSTLLHKKISAIVQCKRYENAKVTIKVVREMYGLMHEYEVDEVYIVTTSTFTKECYAFVENKDITLITGTSLVKLIEAYT